MKQLLKAKFQSIHERLLRSSTGFVVDAIIQRISGKSLVDIYPHIGYEAKA
jgi:hypothetical protein